MFIDTLPVREHKSTDYIIVQTDGEPTAKILFDFTTLGIATSADIQKLQQSLKEMETKLEGSITEVAGSVYTPKGSCEFSALPSLEDTNVGWVYNITDQFQTTDDFIEGPSKTYPAGSNVVSVEYERGTKKWDILGSVTDLSAYAKQSDVESLEELITETESTATAASTAAQLAQAAADTAKQSVQTLETRIDANFLEKD